ncbi:MAG: bifunctional demethylmenaquinone methyltransferase/2-methoxy-6-polyprenyl-1,4-benzoquinol methylase UbiE [Mediterranea massiliensis]|nr:bifunctional demethylmenaquinone methyltransferase/2-methoxy-6-polyprenyl-1,4-benzoquinol methylase UbiE [Mediterranea massiliensis]
MDFPQDKVFPQGYKGSKREQVEAMFNHIAPTYDRLNHTLSLGIDRYWRRKAVKTLLPYHPKQILDVATGTGDFALLAYRILQPDSLTGIDISEKMMEVARRKVNEAGLSEVIRFACEDCTTMSFKNETFDAVTVSFGIRNFVGLDKALQEMYRVLCSNGHLVIVELSIPNQFPMKQLYKIYSKVIIPIIGRVISKDNSAYTYLPESIKAFPQGEVMQEIIKKAGFKEVKFKRLTLGISTLYIATK